ncbi:hypothetical protein [Silvimonas iriomotensis]|uniref:hypothetical protein n=1 Tax=Silvimonas iriomotensis TaxID=449662 RepID=UPI001665C080|nr:hypothetical protein [Silvimonas iriomotensis]
MNGRNPRGRQKFSGRFVMFSEVVLTSEVVANLSGPASKLLLDACSKYRHGRNGDISLVFSDLQTNRSWRSKSTLNKALKELMAADLLVKTRQGYKKKCSLYALGWLPIDACGGKLDVLPGKYCSNRWLATVPLMPPKQKSASTPTVPKPEGNRI